jgi:hypothetical protein
VLPSDIATADVTAYFNVWGQNVSSPEVLVRYSTKTETSLRILVPSISLESNQTSLQTEVLVFANVYPTLSVRFNFTFFAVTPEVISFSPSTGTDTGGSTVWVRIKYFRFPSTMVEVKAGDIIADSKISDASNQITTFISFVLPFGLSVGLLPITIGPYRCDDLCNSKVSFLFTVVDSKALKLLPPVPTYSSFQRLLKLESFPPIYIQHSGILNVTCNKVNAIIFSQLNGNLQAVCSMVLSKSDFMSTIWLQYPSVLASADQLRILITLNDLVNRSISLNFGLVDGSLTNLISVAPSIVPVTGYTDGRKLNFRQKSYLVFSNLSPRMQGLSIYLISNSSVIRADILDLKQTAACNDDVDCNRTSVTLSLPSLNEPGKWGMIINASGHYASRVFERVFEYSTGCDYDFFCADSVVDYLSVLSSPSINCERSACIDDTVVPVPIVASVFPSLGSTEGGTIVEVLVKNFPAFDPANIDVRIIVDGLNDQVCTVVSLNSNGTLRANSHLIYIQMPSVEQHLHGDQMLTISTKMNKLQRAATFSFKYQKKIEGPLVILQFQPASIIVGSDFYTNILVGNMNELQKIGSEYDIVNIRFTLTDPMEIERNLTMQVLSSDGDVSSFLASASSCDKVGIWRIKIESSIQQVAYLNVSVNEMPSPLITGWFPKECASNSWEEIMVTIRYFSMTLFGTNTSATAVMVSENGKSIDLVIKNIKSVNPLCLSRECSVSKIAIVTPVNGNPDNITYDSMSKIILNVKWYDSGGKFFNSTNSFVFKYADATKAKLESVYPKEQLVNSSVLSVIKLTNIPCTNLSLYFYHPINSAAEVHNCLVLPDTSIVAEFLSPLSQIIGSVLFDISNGRAMVSGVLNYVSPPMQVVPADGLTSGGYNVTAYVTGWINMTIATTKAAFLDLTQGAMLATTIHSIERISDFFFVARIQVPAWTSTTGDQAMIQLQSTDREYYSSGIFSFYQSPKISSITPNRASTNGQTSSLDGSSISVSVKWFPNILSTDELLISFSNPFQTLVCDGVVCDLISVRTSIDLLSLKVKVPKFSAGPCTISIKYLAKQPKQDRTVSTSFEFYTPKPFVSSVAYCAQCPFCKMNGSCPLCIQGGICFSNQMLPLQGRAAINNRECLDGEACRGVLQVRITNAPNVDFDSNGRLNKSSAVSCTFGDDGSSMGMVRRIISNFNGILTLEVFPPQLLSPQMLTVSISIQPSSIGSLVNIAFPVMFFDDRVQMYCKTGVCEGPSSGSSHLLTNISSINLDETALIDDQVTIMFSNKPAQIISATKASEDMTTFIIAPPALSDKEASIIGSITVDFIVVWTLNQNIIASSTYTYWVAPRISKAHFSPFGESIEIIFDSNTNRGGQSFQEKTSCNGVISNVVYLGIAARCLWVTDNQLIVYLGFGSTLIPGSVLQVLNLKSFNLKSDLSSPKAVVLAPEYSTAPSLTLKAPQTIDPCSPLELIALSSSPRPLIYRWSSPNDAELSSVLSVVTKSTVEFPEGTPEMQSLDKNYSISVQVTDFLGFSSDIVNIFVFKKSTPVPILTFSPPLLQIIRSNAAEVTGEALFPACAGEKSEIDFKWSQIGGKSNIPSEFLTERSKLRIPPNTLSPGAIYILKLKAAMRNDNSKAAEALFSIQVGVQPLVARIKGGGGEVWSGSSISLDASESRDLDISSLDQQGLEFSWACSVPAPNGLLESCASPDGQILNLPAVAKLYIPPRTLHPSLTGSAYSFFVTVSKRGKLSAAASTSVRVVLESIPEARLTVDADAASFQSDGSLLINADGRLVLRGSCGPESTSDAGTSFKFGFLWSFDPPLDSVFIKDSNYFPLGLQSNNMVMTGKGLDITRMPTSRFTISLTCNENEKLGTVNLAVEINPPPSGGKCEACLRKSSATTCTKNGRPLADLFRMECFGWADNMLPLQYQFGLQSLDDTNTSTWFARSQENKIDFLLPTGYFNLLARVIDAFDAESSILYDTVSTIVSLGVRRVLSKETNEVAISLGNVDSGMLVVNDLVQQGAAGKVNVIIACLGMELNRISSIDVSLFPAEFNISAVELRRETLMLTLMDAFKISIPTSSYVCEAFGAARQVTSSPNLTKHTVLYAENYAHILAISAETIDQSCAASASEFIAAAVYASSLSPSMQAVGVKWLISLESIVSLLLSKASEQLLPGELLALTGSSSHAEIWRIQFIGDQTEFSVCQSGKREISILCLSYGMDVKIPRSILHDLFFPSNQIFNLIINVFDSPPNISTTTLAPLVIVHINIPGELNLSVHNLTNGIMLSIPYHVDHDSNSVACAFWNSLELSYSAAGIHTAIDGNVSSSVHCVTNHLSAFTLIPGNQLQTLTSTLVWPGSQPSTTSVLPGGPGESNLYIGGDYITTQMGKEYVNLSLSSLDHPEATKLGLIVGLVTGFAVFIIAIAATVMIVGRRKRLSESEIIAPESIVELMNTPSLTSMGSNASTSPGNYSGLDPNLETIVVPMDCSTDSTIVIHGIDHRNELNNSKFISNQDQENMQRKQPVNSSSNLESDFVFLDSLPLVSSICGDAPEVSENSLLGDGSTRTLKQSKNERLLRQWKPRQRLPDQEMGAISVTDDQNRDRQERTPIWEPRQKRSAAWMGATIDTEVYGNEMLIAGSTEGAALRITAVTNKNEEEVNEDWGCTAEEVTEDVEEVADQVTPLLS